VTRTVGDFLTAFVRPLVRGGEIHVGKPVSDAELTAFGQQLPYASAELVAVDEARTEAVAELVVRPPSFVLDEDELALAAALHNLLFLAHPRVEHWLTPAGRLDRVREAAQRFAARPRARSRYALLARHGLLHRLFALSRTDVTLAWWTGSATFYGQRPPPRLARWPGLRRVTETSSVVGYTDLLGDPDVEPIIAELLKLSPLTDLLSQPRDGPPLEWEHAIPVLRDPELARAVCYWALSGAVPELQIAAPARFAAAFERYLERRPPAADVRAVAAFLIHLNALLAVAEVGERDLDAPSALLTTLLAPERASRRARGLATFFALPAVLAAIDPALAAPPGVAADDRIARRWRVHRTQAAACVGEAVRDSLESRLRKAIAA
jgi:hypothetical protein